MAFRNTHTPTLAEMPGRPAKYPVPTRMGEQKYRTKTGKLGCQRMKEFYLTPELEDKFRHLYPTTPNREMMQLFGISFSTLQRFKRELHLEKDMKVIRHKLAVQVKRICEKNGYYDSLRQQGVSEACRQGYRDYMASDRYKHPMQIIKEQHPRRYKNLMKKRSEYRRKQIATERLRVTYGLAPKTKLNYRFTAEFTPYTRKEATRRNLALRRGYILGSPDPADDERYTLYYDDQTERAPIFERNSVNAGFKVLPLPPDDQPATQPQKKEYPKYNNNAPLSTIFL